MQVPFEKIVEAREMLKGRLPLTRLVPAPSLSRGGSSAYLKLESDLPTGSFKPRGALYALSLNVARSGVSEVVASSTGNHGAAVAFAAKLLGVRATIFLPENPNPVKRQRIADLGARIVEKGHDIVEACGNARSHAKSIGAFFLNDATDPDLPAGPATIACEILDQLPAVDTIIVPMGDTALIRGVAAGAKHLSPKISIVGVQAERAPAYYLSWKNRKPTSTDTCNTFADGLATRSAEVENVHDILALVDDVRLVTEEQMLGAIRHLQRHEGVMAEPAGAAATAAWLGSDGSEGRQVVLLMTGNNIAPEVIEKL